MSELRDSVNLRSKSIEIKHKIQRVVLSLAQTGRVNFETPGSWEVVLIALVLELEPKISVERILEALPYSGEMLREEDVLNTIANLGFYGRRHVDRLKSLDGRLLPALMITPDGEPLLPIKRLDGRKTLVFHPEEQEVREVDDEDVNTRGNVWIFRRYEENRQSTSHFKRKGSGQTWFRALSSRFRGTLFQVMVVGFLTNLIAISIPIYIMLVYDRVIASAAPYVLPMLCVGAITAIGFDMAFRAVRASGLSWISGRLDNVVGNKVFSHLLSLPPSIIENASVSSQISRIKTFEAVRDFFSSPAFISVLDAPFVILSIVALYLIGGQIFIVPVVAVGLYLVLFWRVRRKIKSTIRLAAKASSARQQFAIETYEKLPTIRSRGLQEKWVRKYRDVSGREMMVHFSMGVMGAIAESLAHAITLLASVATIGFGVHLIWAGLLSPGAMVASMVLTWRALAPFYALCSMVPRLEQIRNSILQIDDLMEVRSEKDENPSAAKLAKINGKVTFDNVSFKYGDGSDFVFRDLSFQAKVGDFVVLTGTTGGGKATILKLIQKLYQADVGAVRIDGFDIRQLNAHMLRKQIAYVPKVPTFYGGSILENLRLVRPQATLDQVQKALEIADAWDTVNRLPNGLSTLIGRNEGLEVNSSLSYKLALARGYLQEASVLLIDEVPNSLMSGRLGANLKNYIANTGRRQTLLLCSYRSDFIDLADVVVNLRGRQAPEVRAQNSREQSTTQITGKVA